MNKMKWMGLLSGILICGGAAQAQNSSFQTQLHKMVGQSVQVGMGGQVPKDNLPRFDLNFPGGTPAELVKAIERAKIHTTNDKDAPFVAGGGVNNPVNVIIPDDCASLKIPAISVQNVTVEELFTAVGRASAQPKIWGGGYHTTSYGFLTDGKPTVNSIWCCHWDKGPPTKDDAPPIYRFYELAPYLDGGLKVEDITTAIETAWKMMGIDPQPKIKYHQDTKLLIAVGPEQQMQIIDSALDELKKGLGHPKADPFPRPAKPQ